MRDFNYCTPTRILFGKGKIKELRQEILKYGKNVLLTYGGGSIKKIGLYDEVLKELDGLNIFELSGIEPNPKYTKSVLPGVKICKEKNIDVILSVGGGSVLDCSKAIAAGALYDGECWDLITYKAKVLKALPIIDIITLAATGSEYDSGAVISREETNDKRGFASPFMFPRLSIIDPTYTFSVSKIQTAAGVSDAINHVLEEFFVSESNTLNDGMMISCIKSLMENGPKALKNPEDYKARSEIMYDSTLACNGILSNGSGPSNWPMHAIEHALSAYFDITHGIGLAIITPRWMEYVLNEKTMPRFLTLAKDLFNIDIKDQLKASKEVINRFYKFFESMSIPMRLKDVGIDSKLEEMAKHVVETENVGYKDAFYPLKYNDVLEILKNSL
jgi:alcohol dehydrogenase YqhD (iron-dependent ADH family)